MKKGSTQRLYVSLPKRLAEKLSWSRSEAKTTRLNNRRPIARTIGNRYTAGFVGDGTTNQLWLEVPNHNGVSVKIDTH